MVELEESVGCARSEAQHFFPGLGLAPYSGPSGRNSIAFLRTPVAEDIQLGRFAGYRRSCCSKARSERRPCALGPQAGARRSRYSPRHLGTIFCENTQNFLKELRDRA